MLLELFLVVALGLLGQWSEGFICDDGRFLRSSFVNDDYCDCADGSDEPYTAACAGEGHTFVCVNGGFLTRRISSAFVGDTICDCCDGSDEAKDMCSNTCRAAAQEYMVEQYRTMRDHHQALVHNTQSIAQLGDIRQMLLTEIEVHQAHLKRLDSVLQELASARRTPSEQEMYLRYKYNKAQKAYSAAYTLLHMNMGYYGEYLALLEQCFRYDWQRKRYGDQGVEVDRYLMELCPFRNATQTAEDGSVIVLGVWDENYHAQLEFAMMYGPGGPPSAGFSVVPVQEAAAPYLEELLLAGGEQCWDGPARSVRAFLSCGPHNRVTAVRENGKCEYEFMMDTPAACTRVGYQQAQERFQELLAYFDFSSQEMAELTELQEMENRRADADTAQWLVEQEELLALRRSLRTAGSAHGDPNETQRPAKQARAGPGDLQGDPLQDWSDTAAAERTVTLGS